MRMKCVKLKSPVHAWASKRVENDPYAGFLLSLSKPFMRAKIRKLLTLVALLMVLPVQAARLALVMGNDNYTQVAKLQKAGNDATAMARELKVVGHTTSAPTCVSPGPINLSSSCPLA